MFTFLRRKEESEHDWSRERISGFLDGTLPAEEVRRFETHLRTCGPCMDEVQSLRATRQLLRAMPMARAPRAFTLAAAPRPVPLPRSFFYLRAATTAAAACFVGLLAVSAAQPLMSPAGVTAASRSQATTASAPAPAAAPAPSVAQPVAPQRAAAPAQDKATAPFGAAPSPAAPAAGAAAAGPASAAAQPSAASQAAPAQPAQQAPSVPRAPGAQPGAEQAPAAQQPQPLQRLAEPTASASALGAPGGGISQQPVTGSNLFLLQLLAAAATVLLAVASGSVWWAYRKR